MASRLGKKTGNVVVWVIIVLLIVGLAGFGVGNFGGAVQSIGSVGDRRIEVDRYATALQQALRQRQRQTGEPLTLAEAEAQGLTQRVLRQVVNTTALNGATERLGISVGDGEVRERLTSIQAFQGIDGGFDREAYAQTLESNGLTEAGFEADLRAEAARNLLQQAVTGAVAVPDPYVSEILGYVNARRSYSAIRLTRADLREPVPDPSQETLQSFYEDNIDRYTAPETKRITYAWLTPAMLRDTVEVGEERLRAAYEERSGEFRQPEQRLVERLVFSDRAAAEEARAAIEARETSFDALVEERGLAATDVDLGEVARDDLSAAAGEAVFALDGPGVAGPADSELGPALFRVNAVLPAEETSFEEARAGLADELAAERARVRVDERIARIENDLAAGATLEELAEETEMELGEIAYTGESREGIAQYEPFRTVAEELTTDDFPEVDTLPNGGIVAARLEEVVEPRERALDEVREQAVADWKAAEAMRMLRTQAETLMGEAESGTALGDLGFEVSAQEGVRRSALSPPALRETVFGLESTGSMGVAAADEAVLLVRLDEILGPESGGAGVETLRAALRSRARQGIAQDEFTYYARALVADAGLSLNQSAINAVQSRLPGGP